MIKKRKVLLILVLIGVLMVVLSSAYSEITFEQQNDEIESVLKSNDPSKLEDLNQSFILNNSRLNLSKLDRILNDSQIDDQVKCYYIDGYSFMSGQQEKTDKFENHIRKYLSKNDFSNMVMDCLISRIVTPMNISIDELLPYVNSNDERVKMRALSTISMANNEQALQLLESEFVSTKSVDEQIQIANYICRIDDTVNVNVDMIDSALLQRDLSEEELFGVVCALSKYKNNQAIKVINKTIGKLSVERQVFIVDGAEELIKAAASSENHKNDVSEILKKVPLKKYEKEMNDLNINSSTLDFLE